MANNTLTLVDNDPNEFIDGLVEFAIKRRLDSPGLLEVLSDLSSMLEDPKKYKLFKDVLDDYTRDQIEKVTGGDQNG